MLSFTVASTVIFIIFFILAVGYLTFFVINTSFGIITGTFQISELGFYLFFFLILEIPAFLISLRFFLERRRFLAIGPSGVYYRKIMKTGYFRWGNVIAMKGKIITKIGLGPKTATVTVAKVMIRLSGENIYFESSNYSHKEFAKKIKLQMFLNLFQTYSELAFRVRILKNSESKRSSENALNDFSSKKTSDWKKQIKK